MKRFLLASLLMGLISFGASAQFNLTLTTYNQDFDGLGTATSTGVTGGDLNIVSSTLNGWYFSESGTGANIIITAGTGTSTTGDTYNFGLAAASNRTLGGLQSGSLNPTIGFYVTNNTGAPITALAITYTGKQWRLGATGRVDRLDFQYSTDATSLTTGTWTDADLLDFTAPVNSGATGALDGNQTANQTTVTGSIISLSIANGTTFFIRWNDLNATGSDDGLGVDDFNMIATLGSSNTITTGLVSAPPFVLTDCSDTETGTVAFTSTGTFNAGNTYSAQLSDDLGSFAIPTVIGTLVDNSNAGTINITIPAGTAGGTGYRIRVISDNPAVTGSTSAAFTITQQGTGGCSSSHTDYYRSLTSGDWTDPTTWQSSPDNTNWITATLAPTFNANTIQIRAPHTVTIDGISSADQLTIELGATLNHANGSAFTLNNGTGTDMTIQNGAIYVLNGTQPSGAGTVDVQNGSTVRVDDNSTPGDADDFAFGNANVTFNTGCIYDWNTILTPSWTGRVYFTNGQNTKYRFSQSTGSLGGNSLTLVYGHLEANANLVFINTGTKTFVNGIIGTGTIDASAAGSGAVIINGATSVLGGGTLTLQSGVPLQVTNTTCTMTTNKIISGDITFSGTSLIVLGNFDLTVSGFIGGYSNTAYVQTNGTGYLKMNSIGGSRIFPIGTSTLTPVYIDNGNLADYSARVEDGINPPLALPINGIYAVQRTWNIFASATTAGVLVTYQYNVGEFGTGVNATDLMEILLYSGSAWSVIPGQQNLVQFGSNPYQVNSTAAGLTIGTSATPYLLGKSGGFVLPIDCIISTRAQKRNNTGIISWTVNSCADVTSFEVQRSVGNGIYQTIGTINPLANQTDFNFTDPSLAKGTNLYRIKVNRLSGSIKYSNTVALIHESDQVLITSVVPNPVHHAATLTLSADRQGSADFKVYSISGSLVKQWHSKYAEGNNTIEMDVSELPAGIYQVLVSTIYSKTVTRFIKQ
ncbi:MAG: T9SS type A sorting domain-containing protein [Chitinophagaceae bacterium]|nr:T9SS type A sorting domain-containing protein [Chitinophagaceae bacterium]